MDCPGAEAIQALIDLALPDAEREPITEHAEGCAACRALLVGLVRTGAKAPSDGVLVRGTAVGRYVIEAPLGAGAMGTVYAAHDPELDRRVAIKVLRSEVAGAGSRGRLLREAQALARVKHPAVVAVHDVGLHAGQVFIAMELIDGETLRAWLAGGRRGWREVAERMLAAGRGLAAAHAAGVLHRDLKPDNVLIARDGRVVVGDFGLARLDPGQRIAGEDGAGRDGAAATRRAATDGAAATALAPAAATDGAAATALAPAAATQTGSLLGTPAYMAPEQLRGEAATAASDQFGFVVTLYEALYGARPFDDPSVGAAADPLAALLGNILGHRRVAPPPDRRAPRWLRRLIARGLEPAPSDRHPSIERLLADLARGLRRRRRLAIGGALALGGVAALAGGSLIGGADPPAVDCRASARLLDGRWDPAVRAEVTRAFGASGHPLAAAILPHVIATADAYAARWLAMHEDACRATHERGEQSADLLDRRMACLEGRAAELTALGRVLAIVDADAVGHAIDAAEQLGSLASCADAAVLRAPVAPPPAALAARVAAARERVAAARVIEDAGRHGDAAALLARVGDEARALGYPPLEAEARLAEGRTALLGGDPARADALLRDALRLAEAAGHDRVKARAAAYLVGVAGQLGRRDEAGHLAELAAAAIARIGGDPEIELELAGQRAGAATSVADFPAAIAALERVVELARGLHGERSRQVVIALAELGWARAAAGQLDAAAADSRAAGAIASGLYGGQSEEVVAQLMALDQQAMSRGDFAGSIRLSLEALAIAERSRPDHPDLALMHTTLGMTYELDRQFAAAHDHQVRAAELLDRTGDAPPLLAEAWEAAGWMSIRLGLAPRAVAELERGVAAARALGPAGAAQLAKTTSALGRARLDGGDVAGARRDLEWALARHEAAAEIPPARLAGNRFQLARALWQDGTRRSRERARPLAEQARAGFSAARDRIAGQGGPLAAVRAQLDADLAEVDAWLATRAP